MQNAKATARQMAGRFQSVCILTFEFSITYPRYLAAFTGNGAAVWHGVGLKFASFGSRRKFVLV